MDVTALGVMLALGLATQDSAQRNLDFRQGSFLGWQRDKQGGFYLTGADRRGPSLRFQACSSDNGQPGRAAMLHRSVTLPHGAGVLSFDAYAVYSIDPSTKKPHTAFGDLNVLLLGPGKKPVPLKVLTADKGWQPATTIRPAFRGEARHYHFDVNRYGGQTLRLALVDDDKRPGCYLVAGNFRLVSHTVFEGGQFGEHMVKLAKDQKLKEMTRYESPHFIGISNAEDSFSELRLQNCELIYDEFFEHFQSRGFRLSRPPSKLMVAIFENQAGFNAYMGQAMSPFITGVYHPGTNRLVVYDYGQNDAFVEVRRQISSMAKRIRNDVDRQRFHGTTARVLKVYRTETNIATVMHEVSHQLSFNTGLLNREGDLSIWLAEGLATYCEATNNSVWQGIGEMNPERIEPLRAATEGRARLIPLKDLILGDEWLRGPKATAETALMGYSQSWALFKMLMEEQPDKLRSYLKLIYNRKTAERRFDDFTNSFGKEIGLLELRFVEYIKSQVKRHVATRY